MKIISLLPSATEIVFALGLGESLEGVTHECDYPAEATEKPIVSRPALPPGPLSSREIDAAVRERMDAKDPLYVLDRALIQRVQPDVILTQDLCRVCAVPTGQVEAALADLGVDSKVLSLDPNTLEEIFLSVEAVGKLLDRRDAAKEITEGLRARVEAMKKAALRLPTIRVLAQEWLDPPFAGGHWIPEMIELAGGTNLLAEKGEPSRQVSWREIRDATPEVVLFMPCGYYLDEAEEEAKRLFDNPEFADTPAAREGNVFAVDATSYFSRPGPRIVDGLEILAWAVHPEAYPEPPADTIVRIQR
ncbi:MAG: cobalamin-binding protein [Actinomycetota bacterium]